MVSLSSPFNGAIAKYSHRFRMGFGAMSLSLRGRPSEQQALESLLYFFENGGNFIDTADVYGLDDGDRGHNEKLITKAVKQFSNRNDILIATKGGASRPRGGWALGGGQPKLLRQACEKSLKNLERETHALYYLHGPDKTVPLEDSLGELIKLKEEGKILHLGISNVDLLQLQFALSLTPLAAVQNRCNPFCKEDFASGLIEFCRLNQLAYVAYCPLGGWLEHKKLTKYPEFQHLALKYQVSTYQISLAWLLQKGKHICPIPGMSGKEQVRLNKKAFSITLSDEDMRTIDLFPNLYLPKHID
jgi:aryl-alcohol dehydrogenase-like predicted oxidoreductase